MAKNTQRDYPLYVCFLLRRLSINVSVIVDVWAAITLQFWGIQVVAYSFVTL